MLKGLRKFLSKHERMALLILAVITALLFGVSPQLLTQMGEKGDADFGQIYGKEITQEQIDQIQIRWERLTNFFASQPLFLRGAPHFEFADFEKWWESKSTEELKDSDYSDMANAYFTNVYSLLDIPPFNLADYHAWWDGKKIQYYKSLGRTIAVLINMADAIGLDASPKEVQAFITNNLVFFQDQNRNFNLNQYKYIVNRSIGLTEGGFEKTIKEWMQIIKLTQLRQESIFPSLEEIFDEYVTTNKEIKIKWVAFNPDDYMDKTSMNTTKEIDKFFKDNEKDYQIPQKVRIEYLMAGYEKLKDTVRKPTPDEITTLYNNTKEEKYQITVAAPLTGTPPMAYKPLPDVQNQVIDEWKSFEAKAKAIEVINNVNERIKELILKEKPVDLEMLAGEFSLEYNSTGFFSQDQLSEIAKEMGTSPILQQRVFDTPENIASNPISSDKGEIIFKVLKKKEAYTPPFTLALKEKVSKDLKKMKAKEFAQKKAQELYTKIVTEITEASKTVENKTDEDKKKELVRLNKNYFDTVLRNRGFNLNQTDWFKKDKYFSELKDITDRELITKLFNMNEGDFSMEKDKDTCFLMLLTDKRLPNGEDFDDLKPELKSQVQSKQTKDFIKVWYSELKLITDKLKPEAPQTTQSTTPPQENTN